MEDILGYTFDEILKAQQGGRLGRVIDTSKPEPFDPVQERADVKLLHGLGEAKLRELGYFGVIDRLERGGYLSSNAKVTGSPALSASPSGLPGYATEVEK
jgi:hypothetical protein